MDDGMIEVIGLTTYQLPLLQAGGHGTCLAQCKSAKIVTSKTIPMQVRIHFIYSFKILEWNLPCFEKLSIKKCIEDSNH